MRVSSTNYTRLLAPTNRSREHSSHGHGVRVSSENDYQTSYLPRQNQPPLRQNLRHYGQEPLSLQPISTNIPTNVTDRSIKEAVIVKKINPTREKKPLAIERNSTSIRGRGVIYPQKDHHSFVDKENRMSFLDGGKRHSFGGVTRTSFIETHTVNAEENLRNSYASTKAVTRKGTMECLARESKQGSEMALKTLKAEAEKTVQKPVIESKQECEVAVTEYASVIMDTLKMKEREAAPDYCLRNHKIPSSLRAKMVDWMVEVLTSYKCSEQTFFVAVNTMDLFLQKTKNVQEIADLHLTGVTCMFMASKYEDIYALRLKVICEKIAHNKLTPDQIKLKEMEILSTLEYKMTNATLYEFIMNALSQMKVKETLSPKLNTYLHRVCVYLAKATLHDYDIINQQNYSALAGAIISVGLKVLLKLERALPIDKMLAQLTQILRLNEDVLTEAAARALSFTKNFEKLYPNLTNLRKFDQLNYNEQSQNAENSSNLSGKGKN